MFPTDELAGGSVPCHLGGGRVVADGGYTGPLSGGVAEWLGRGLQSLAHRFDSGPRLETRYDAGISGA